MPVSFRRTHNSPIYKWLVSHFKILSQKDNFESMKPSQSSLIMRSLPRRSLDGSEQRKTYQQFISLISLLIAPPCCSYNKISWLPSLESLLRDSFRRAWLSGNLLPSPPLFSFFFFLKKRSLWFVHVGRLTGISVFSCPCTKPKQFSELSYHHGITPNFIKLYNEDFSLCSLTFCK